MVAPGIKEVVVASSQPSHMELLIDRKTSGSDGVAVAFAHTQRISALIQRAE